MIVSEFTYLERCTIYVYVLVYFLYSIWTSDGFQCLQPKKIFSGELKSVLTILMMLTMSCQFACDTVMTYVKYTEGYMILDNEPSIKPYEYWTPYSQQLQQVSNYIQAVTYSFQTSLYFMLQCFWNYLSNSVAKKDFMSSFEFKFYIVWSALSMAMFPILQWYFRYDSVKEEVIPKLAYTAEVIITALLGIRTFFRFRAIIKNGRDTNANPLIINKLKYFMDINSVMTALMFSYALSFIIMFSAGMAHAQIIAKNRFAIDCILANINIVVLFLYILFIAIFHPRKSYGTSNSVANPSSADPSNGKENISCSKGITTQTKQERIAEESQHTMSRRMPSHKRFSQRVTSFIGQRFQQQQQRMVEASPTDSFQQTFEQSHYNHDVIVMTPTATTSSPHSITLSSTITSAAMPSPSSPSSPSSSYARGPLRGYQYESKTFMRPMSPISVDFPTSAMAGDTAPLNTAPSPQPPSPTPYSSSSYLLQQQRYQQPSAYTVENRTQQRDARGSHDNDHTSGHALSNPHSLDLSGSSPPALQSSDDWLRKSPERRI